MPEAQGPSSTPRPLFPRIAAVAIPSGPFLLLSSILVFGSVGAGQFLYGMDLIGGFYALRGSVAGALAEGRLPLWDPHVMMGFPMLAEPQSAVLYPPTWCGVLLTPGTFWTLSAWAHLILAGSFAQRWLKRGLGLHTGAALAGAFVFMMSGYIAGHVYAGHVNYLWAYPWIPALLWRLERYLAEPSLKRGTLLAVVLALLFLAGVPADVFYLGLILLGRLTLYTLSTRQDRRRRILISARGIAWLAMGLLFCAPQLLLTLELIGQGQRVSINNYDFITSYSVAPVNYLELLAPTFFGDGRETPIWCHGFISESHGFIGIAGLVLSGIGLAGRHRQRFLWAGIALMGALLAMGRYSPVFRAYSALVPGAGLFRVPARYLLLYVVALAALTGIGFDFLWNHDGSRRLQIRVVAAVAAVVALVAVGLWLPMASGEAPGPRWWTSLRDSEREAFRAEQGIDAPPASLATSARSLLWASLCGGASALCLLVRRGPSSAMALGFLLVGELWVYSSRFYIGYPVDGMTWPQEFTSYLRNNPNFPCRVATVAMSQLPEIGKCQLAGLDHVGGYDPMMLRRYTELVNVARGKPASDVVVAMAFSRPGPLFDLFGARYWIVPGERQEPPGWRTIGQLPAGFVYENAHALPRAFLVGRSVRIESDDERLRYLAGPEFRASRVAVLENGNSGESGHDVSGDVRIESMVPGAYELKVDVSEEAWLVLSEAWYPGWTVEVDGRSAELLRADHLFQAVSLPAGRHEVRFRYRSRFLFAGLAVAALAALVPLGLLVLRRFRSPRPETSSSHLSTS